MMDISTIEKPGLWRTFLLISGSITFSLLLVKLISTGVDFIMTIVEGMFITGLLSMVFIYLVSPLVSFFERQGLSRLLAVLVSYVILITTIVLMIVVFSPDIGHELSNMKLDLPRYVERLNQIIQQVFERLKGEVPYLANFSISSDLIPKLTPHLEGVLTEITRSIFTILSLLITVPLFSFFILLDGQMFKRNIYALVPNRYFEMTMDMMNKINFQLRSFIRGRFIEALLVGLCIVIGLSFVKLKYLWFLGFFAGVANLIPYIGPIIGMVPGLFIAIVECDNTGQIIWVFVLYILIAQIILDTFILIPILISKVANLHPLIVFLAIIVGGQIQGVLGMIIAVPVINIFFIVITESYRYILKRKTVYKLR